MKIRIMTAVLCLLFLSFGVVAGQAATLTVTKIADTNDNVCNAADCSLREAIFAASSGDTIEFASPLFDTAQIITLAFGELYINKALTINGKGAKLTTINANNISRVFVIDGHPTTLRGLKITGGRVTGNTNGAGIYIDGQTSIDDCEISGNFQSGVAAIGGGGIYLAQGRFLTIKRSTISNNRGTNLGAGIYTSENTALLMYNTTISGNILNGNFGGGLYISTTASLEAYNCTITGNTSQLTGGGIHLVASGNTSRRLYNTIVTGNSAPTNPDLSGALSENNHTFIGGDARLMPLGDYGGSTPTHALLPDSPAINSGNNCVLTAGSCGDGNQSMTTDQRGAGYIRRAGAAIDRGAFEVIPFVRNANSSGADSLRQLILDTPAGDVVYFDPAFFNVPRTIEMDGTNLTVNKNLTINGPGANLLTLDGENATYLFSISNVTLTLSGMRLTRGFAAFNGGAVVLSGGILNAAAIQIDGSRANNKGGGIALFGGTLNLTDSIITGNSSGVEGGGIRLEPGSNATITNSTVSNNSTESENGGAIAGYNAGFVLNSSTLNGNRAVNGGAVFMGGFGHSIINNSTVSGNTATTGRGGAILIIDTARLDTTNTTITNNKNKSNQTGGIFVQSPADYRTRNTIIAGNCNQNDESDCRSTSTMGNPDATGVINSFGYNLLGSTTGNSYIGNTTGNLVGAANLAVLGNYGGATQTHALFPNSQAINAGDTNNSFAADQRNSTRPVGGRGDIGAFERNITFNQATLPNGVQSAVYDQTLTVMRLTSLADDQITESLAASNPDFFAPFTFAVVSIAGQSLPNGLILSPGGQIIGTPTIIGSFTFTVKASDADGMAGVQQYTIAVVNTPPTITASGISLTQSSPVSNSTIATVGDIQSGANGVTVTITGANPLNGVTVSTIVNTNGTVTANAVAACNAANASFTLTATDGSGATATSTLTVMITGNTAPTLIYPASFNVGSGGSLNAAPTTAADNGAVSYSIFSVSPAMTTAPTVDASGGVSITDANPTGSHTITVRATDACSLATDASFVLNVEQPIRIVTKIEDTNDGVCDTDCSLREAITTAVSGDTVQFAAPLFDSAQTITLASELNVTGKTLIITGRAANLTAVSGNNASRVFNVGGGGNLTLNKLTVKNGRNFSEGGGIYNGATLIITNSAVSDNSVSGGNDNFGGGIYNGSQATLTIRNSTISGNSVTGSSNFANRGGGIANYNGTLTITNSTVSGNTLGGGRNNRGGGIYSESGTLTIINDTITANYIAVGGFNFGGGLAIIPDGMNLVNSIISGNFATGNPDILGAYNPNFNLIGGDARLAPLGFYGGATRTHALLSDSPALNAGNNCVLTANLCANGNPALANDQRGSQRGIGEIVDIGAFESNIAFDQTSLPNASVNINYSQQISAARQTNFAGRQNLAPTVFEIVPADGQSLPPGITLSLGGSLSGSPAMTGTYTFTVKATDTDGIAGAQQYTIQVFAPTSATVSVSGRVLTANGSGLKGATVVLIDSSGNTSTANTSSFGYFRFDEVEAGQTYVFTVVSKRFQFQPQVVTVTEELTELNFTAQ